MAPFARVLSALAVLAACLTACAGEEEAPPPRRASPLAVPPGAAARPAPPLPDGLESAYSTMLARHAEDGRAFGVVDARVLSGPREWGSGRALFVASGRGPVARLSLRGEGPHPLIEERGPFHDLRPVDGQLFSPGLARLASDGDDVPPQAVVLSVISASPPDLLGGEAWSLWVYAQTWLGAGGRTPPAAGPPGSPEPQAPSRCDYDAEARGASASLAAGRVGDYLRARARLLDRYILERLRCPPGPLTSRTDTAGLESRGVDVDRLFLGLVVEPDVAALPEGDEPLSARVLAQWIRESGRASALVPALADMARDERWDRWTRIRAQIVLSDVAEEQIAPSDTPFEIFVRRAFGQCAREVGAGLALAGWGVCE